MSGDIKLPRLILNSIVRIEFEASAALNADIRVASDNTAMDCGTACRRRDIATERQVLVEVHLRPHDKDVVIPYRCNVSALVVLSEFDQSLSPEQMDEMAANLGAPVAYALVRDELQRLTATGPHQRVILPLVGRQFLIGSTTYQDENGETLPRPVAAKA